MSCLNPVLRQRRGDHGVLLHETLMSAVLGENRHDHHVQRHESLLNSVLGQNHEDLEKPQTPETAAEPTSVFSDAVLNVPAFSATDSDSASFGTFAKDFSAQSSAMQP